MKVISPLDQTYTFPPVDAALKSPNGLLAVGGDLSIQRLLSAYSKGIFPWYSLGDPILWWSPDPRLVLLPQNIKISRSMRKVLRRKEFKITFDQAFAEVISACSTPRPDQEGTWITPEMSEAYIRLHQAGFAHSAEAWYQDKLVGGLYGVSIGQVFFGESMFAQRSNASKAAFCTLVKHLSHWNFKLIDCQVHTSHLASLGAEEISRKKFSIMLQQFCSATPSKEAWSAPDEFIFENLEN